MCCRHIGGGRRVNAREFLSLSLRPPLSSVVCAFIVHRHRRLIFGRCVRERSHSHTDTRTHSAAHTHKYRGVLHFNCFAMSAISLVLSQPKYVLLEFCDSLCFVSVRRECFGECMRAYVCVVCVCV